MTAEWEMMKWRMMSWFHTVVNDSYLMVNIGQYHGYYWWQWEAHGC